MKEELPWAPPGWLPNPHVSVINTPKTSAPHDEIWRFALSLDGYGYSAARGFDAAELGNGVWNQFRKTGALPAELSLGKLRVCLFFLQRAMRWNGLDIEPMEAEGRAYAEALLEAVRAAAKKEHGNSGYLNYTHCSELCHAVEAALIAGHVLREDFNRAEGPKGGHGKAEADDRADSLIEERLRFRFPEDGYSSEELGLVRPVNAKTGRLWSVDPNDGTSAYLRGFRGAAVSIALLVHGEPVLGVVYAYNHPDDDGDLICWQKGGPLLRNGAIVERDWANALRRSGIALLSQDADKNPRANAEVVHPMRFRAVPSVAYRLALAAVGDGDAGGTLNGPFNWSYDMAGGHALLLAVGGDLYDATGKRVSHTADGQCQSSTSTFFGGDPVAAPEMAKRDWSPVYQRAKSTSSYPLVWPSKGRAPILPEVLSRAQGCLLGQLAGDALGSLVEFQSAQQIALKYGNLPLRLKDGGTWNTIAGQPTDDSELALMLARSLVGKVSYDPEVALAAYKFWLASSPFDVGATTHGGLHGHPNQTSQANGALMRVSPLGIFGAGFYYKLDQDDRLTVRGDLDLDLVFDWASADAALTHPHPVCRDCNGLYAMAIAHAISTGGDAQELLGLVGRWAAERNVQPQVREVISVAETRPPSCFDGNNQGWVLIAFQNALYRLVHSSSLENAVQETVRCGGDTDTNAAICGALLGAVYGRRGLAADWLNAALTCRPIKGMDHVQQPRPECFWPVDALMLAEELLMAPILSPKQ